MPEPDSISIVIPALNEEERLEQSVRVTAEAARDHFASYEILVFNDGSADSTGEIADRIAAEMPQVQAFHHDVPHCIGGVLREGLERAKMTYFMWVDAKGATPREALDQIFSLRGEAELVVPYAKNQEERSRFRQLVSRTFQSLLNFLFRMDLRQYTHLVLCRTETARRYPIETSSYAYQAEALIKMIKGGCSYVQVGVIDNFESESKTTKAFRINNVIGVATFLVRSLWEVYGSLMKTRHV